MEFPLEPDQFYESSQGRTHYRRIEVPGAQTILILPGVSIPSAAYAAFAADLSEGFDVITIDYFGRGFSEPNDSFPHTLDGYAEQVLSLLAHLKIESAGVVAFSFGSLIAANIAERCPALITQLVFISPFHFLHKHVGPFQKFLIGNRLFGEMVVRAGAQASIAADITQQFRGHPRNDEVCWSLMGCCLQQLITNKKFCLSLSRFIGNFSESAIPDEMQKATQMSVRALVLIGENDKVIDVDASGAWWKRWMPNVVVEARHNVGHLMFLEDPSSISQRVARFLHH